MNVKQVTFTFEKEFYAKLQTKAQQNGYKNVQQYGYDLLHHVIYGKKHRGGRPRYMGYDDRLARMTARPTKDSAKIVRWAKARGLWD